MPDGSLRAVPEPETTIPASAAAFAQAVRTVGGLARRGGLVVPVFRSPPRIAGVDRTLRRQSIDTSVVAVRLGGRPLAAVRSDVIEGVVVANGLDQKRADRFRRAAWQRLDGPSRNSSGSSGRTERRRADVGGEVRGADRLDGAELEPVVSRSGSARVA